MVKQVGSWVLRTQLGQGSFGEVYLAEHAESGMPVAVKVSTKQLLAKGQGRTLLKREIATMKALDHPNVLKLYEVLETAKRFYLVIEYVDKGELFDLIKENKGFEENQAKKYFRQLIAGLHYCHSQGIVHRDLKPQNLLLTSKDQVKIADFGFSRFQELDEGGQARRLQTQCGTPNYAAPEIFLGEGYDGFKTDIWATGVILYFMLQADVPFKPLVAGQGLQGVVMAIVQGVYSIPSSFSPQAGDLVKKILVVDPEKRYRIEDVENHPWVGTSFTALPKIVVSDTQIRDSIQFTEDMMEDIAAQEGWSPGKMAAAQHARRHVDPASPPGAQAGSPVNRSPRPSLTPVGSSSKTPASPPKSPKATGTPTGPGVVQAGSPPPPGNGGHTRHVFKRCNYNTLKSCFYCGNRIFGVGKHSGFGCINCGCPVHVRCVDGASENSYCEQYQKNNSK